MKVILFVLDAFRYDYISKKTTPFLWEYSKKGKYIKHIEPSAGFCERTEIFTGLKPNESGFFTAIGFDPENSPYKNNYLLSIIGGLEVLISKLGCKKKIQIIYRKVMLKLLRRFFSNFKLKPYNIPFSFLKYFNLTEDEFEMIENKRSNSSSIFNIVEMKGGLNFLDAFTSLGKPSNGTDTDRINLAISSAKNKEYLFTPIYIGGIDSQGHKLGPNSDGLKTELNKLDSLLKKSINELTEIDKEINFVLLGDHGMTEIKTNFDAESVLTKEANALKLKKGTDYIYFLDSTLLRVWYLTEIARTKLDPIIRKNELFLSNGEIISKKTSELFDIPLNDRRYGDIAWWANEGVLIFPDFFHNDTPHKGMHGYKPIFTSTHGTCIAVGRNIKQSYQDSMKLNNVYKLISDLINK